MNQHCFFRLTSALAALLALGMPLHAANLTGKWAWTIETPDGTTFESMMHAKQDGEKLTGHVSRPGSDDQLKLEKGKVVENKVSFTVKPDFQGNIITVDYSGKRDGNQIKGTINVVDFGAELQWHAKRVQDNADPTGQWDWTLATPDGNEVGATLTFSKQGGKLSGELIADNWAVELDETKVQGKTIQFAARNPNTGQEYALAGKITGKSMNGKVSFTNDSGEEISLSWKAKKR